MGGESRVNKFEIACLLKTAVEDAFEVLGKKCKVVTVGEGKKIIVAVEKTGPDGKPANVKITVEDL